jgi:multidrug efflux pump subunit AcrB
MKEIITFFIRNYKLTITLSIFLIFYGLIGMRKMNAESYPSVNFAMANIETRYPGATPEDIETKITKKIEDKIRTVSGLKDVRSFSQSGLSKIFVRIDMDNENVNVKEVMNDLEKAVDGVSDLPQDLIDDPKFLEIKSEEFPAIELALIGDNTDRKRDLLADQLKEELEDNKRVLGVRLTGYMKREFRIKLKQDKLAAFHIGLDEVLRTIAARNVNIPGGNLKQADNQLLVRLEGKVKDAKDLSQTVIRSNFSGQKVTLADVADVMDNEEEPVVLGSYNGKPATLLIVTKKGGADTIKLVGDVEKVLNRFKFQYKDYEFAIYNNEALKVKDKLDVLYSNAVSGLILVVLFLLIFLPGRIGIMASLSLPLAMMATLGIMPALGLNLNAITILALVIALGMLVDNAVVIAENFTRLKQDGMNTLDASIESVQQLWLPISATAFTTIAAFMPMLVTKGIMGQFIKAIPIVVSISLFISLLESFFLLPMRLRLFGGKVATKEQTKANWFDGVIVKFEKIMDLFILRRYWVAVGFGLLIVGSFLLMAFGNKFILFPAEQTEIYMARVEMPKGSTIEKTNEVIKKVTLEIQKTIPDYIKSLVGRAGNSQGRPDDPKGKEGDYVGMIVIYANDFAKNNVNYLDVLQKLRQIKVDGVKSLTFEEMVNGPPVGAAINATFRSNDKVQLNAMVSAIQTKLASTPGIVDLSTDDVIGEDEVFVDVDFEKSSRLGLTVKQVGDAIRTALSGTLISNVTLKNKEVDLKVEMANSSAKNVQDIAQLNVMDNRGNLIPINTVAKFTQSEGTPVVKRFDYKRSKTLNGSVDEAVITSIKANAILRQEFDKLQTLYPEVSLVFGGAEESTKESLQSLGDAMILALIGIFATMVFLFRSFLRPAIIMSTIPLGLVGFAVAFFFHNRPISFLAMIGIIGLAGIIVNSGIVLISFIDEMRAEGKMSLHDILVKSSGMRLRAVMVTSLTTISGLFPTAYGIGGSDAMLIPLTLAMAWGLTSGTILTLVWIPCAYAILEDWISYIKKIRWVQPFFKITED